MSKQAFLTAQWTHLAMLNYEVEPRILSDFVPSGTELDLFAGRALVSMVGFLYHDTRVLGVGVPWHRHFEEVNLRYYICRRGPEGWRRGVAFVKEIVPKRAVAWVARTFYEENFVRMPMRHKITNRPQDPKTPDHVEYRWRFQGDWQRLSVRTVGAAVNPTAGSEEEFITEHYWGYTKHSDGSTSEYEVAHPSWRVWQVAKSKLDCDVARLYGESFVDFLSAKPTSAFLAAGSEVTVYRGTRL